jgi:hypothetical protein
VADHTFGARSKARPAGEWRAQDCGGARAKLNS